MKKKYYLLSSLILIALIIRILFIWIGRPEFVGWFNHTYYYYVQTKGLILNGSMPFNDMPFLFYLYSFTSKLLIGFGMSIESAIINSSKLWMSLIPSLLPIPIYSILKKISSSEKLPKWGWVFVFLSAFYPLSLLYIPEFLQKNALGLLLLAILINLSINLLKEQSPKNIVFFIVVFLTIIITHYGTAGISLLYCLAIATAMLLLKNYRSGIKVIFGLLFGLSIALYLFSLFDLKRVERVLFYLEQMLDTSVLGIIFSNSSNVSDRLSGLLLLIIPILIFWAFYHFFKQHKLPITQFVKVFWLTNVIFTYLLVLPLYDQLLLGRFVLFITIPLLIVLYLTLLYTSHSITIRKIVISVPIIFIMLMAFGEFMSLKFHTKSSEKIYGDIVKLKEEFKLNENDLIIGRNGVEHISNWFLGTKSCIITSFNITDFNKYNRIFILNPTEATINIQENYNKDKSRYNLMLGNVPMPKTGKVVFSAQHLNLIEVTKQPEEWVFNKDGSWVNFKTN